MNHAIIAVGRGFPRGQFPIPFYAFSKIVIKMASEHGGLYFLLPVSHI